MGPLWNGQLRHGWILRSGGIFSRAGGALGCRHFGSNRYGSNNLCPGLCRYCAYFPAPVRGILAILTLGFGEVIRLVILSEEWLTGGSLGLPGIPRPFWRLVSEKDYELLFLGLLVLVVLGLFIALEILVRSPFGRAIRAVREDDIVVATLGKNVTALRVKAFAIGGAVIGVAGAFHAFYLTYIDPSQFSAIITAYTFMAVIAGGRGSNKGLLLGAAVIMCLIEGSRFLKDVVQVLDATQLAAIRLILIGLGPTCSSLPYRKASPENTASKGLRLLARGLE